ncbi:hypothetical protein ADK67_07155 [Saccharothrix sp. NRRL B-16348]|nr:hypothetical protein ADK67_07155 [Saccharothrix sp. NRRL B-16348]
MFTVRSTSGNGGGDRDTLLTAALAAEVAVWYHYFLLLSEGGEASGAVMAAQGLALGLRSAATWLQLR